MSISDWLRKIFAGTVEVPSSSDIVPESSIIQSYNAITINLARLNIPFTEMPKVWIPSIPDTNSMDPGFDFNHNNILIAGANEVDQKLLVDFISVGDIAVYKTATIYAIHRIVGMGYDNQGKYFKFRGDNNYASDPDRVRENELQWLCIGTIF